MSTWSALTLADVQPALAAAQLTVLRQRSLGEGQSDPLPALLADITARVRAEIRAGRKNQLERDASLLPPELKLAAIHLALEALQTRLPTLGLSADQVRLANDARQLLGRVARGEMALSSPMEPETAHEAQRGYGIEVLRHRGNPVANNRLAGL